MQGGVPDGSASTPTGPELCALLASVAPADVCDEQLSQWLTAQYRQLAYQQAQVWAVMSEIGRRDPMAGVPLAEHWNAEQIFESGVEEIRAQLLFTRRFARRELENADGVVGLPRVFAALTAGLLDRARAIVLADGCLDLTDAQTCIVLDRLLPEAGQLTTGQLAEQLARLAIALDPAWAERRYREAVRERKVVGYLNPDGSAVVSGQNLPADQAAAGCARVDALADTAKRSGAAGKIDQLRAEVFLGLLDGSLHGLSETAIVAELVRRYPKLDDWATAEHPGGEHVIARHAHRHASAKSAHTAQPVEPADAAADAVEPADAAADAVEPADAAADAAEPADAAGTADSWDVAVGVARGMHLRVGLGTLLGIDEQPGEIAGWGPVPASVARRIANRQRSSEWRFAIVDDAGDLLLDGITRRRPRTNTVIDRAGGRGGIVELHVPLALLTDRELVARHPDWAQVMGGLADQYAQQRPIEQDPIARFPGRPLRRHTETFFQRCLFAGCRRPAADCDADHRKDHALGGRTDGENMGPSCRHDHGLKTSGGWRMIRKDDRTFVWISPLGSRHTVRVDPVAPPLPEAEPRQQPPEFVFHRDDEESPPTFRPVDQRGNTLTRSSTAESAESERDGSGADPPPY